ncbi:MAG: gluconolaconase [Cyanobacteria bacterium RYN_339]|nr:gluconolaconase [Cyanobacteria bacterium RYN_339]
MGVVQKAPQRPRRRKAWPWVLATVLILALAWYALEGWPTHAPKPPAAGRSGRHLLPKAGVALERGAPPEPRTMRPAAEAPAGLEAYPPVPAVRHILASRPMAFKGARLWRQVHMLPGYAVNMMEWQGMAFGPGGKVAVAPDRGLILEVLPDGNTRPLAGNRLTGTTDGLARDARFNWVQKLAYAPDGTLYISAGAQRLCALSPQGRVTTLPFKGWLTGVDAQGYVYWLDVDLTAYLRWRPGGKPELAGSAPEHHLYLNSAVSPEGACYGYHSINGYIWNVWGRELAACVVACGPLGPSRSPHVMAAAPGGHLYAIGYDRGPVFELRPDGSRPVVLPLGERVQRENGFPSEIATDGAGRVYAITSTWQIWVNEPAEESR